MYVKCFIMNIQNLIYKVKWCALYYTRTEDEGHLEEENIDTEGKKVSREKECH